MLALYLDNINISDGGLNALVGKCPQLQQLFIIDVPGITNQSILSFIKTTPKLICFCVYNHDLNDSDITTIAQHCPKLYGIGIFATSLTDIAIESLCKYCTQLRDLDLINCIGICTGFYYPKNLERLCISHCPKLTITMVRTIMNNNPFLERLELTHCPQLTNDRGVYLNKLTVVNSFYDTIQQPNDICQLVNTAIQEHFNQITASADINVYTRYTKYSMLIKIYEMCKYMMVPTIPGIVRMLYSMIIVLLLILLFIYR